jgi:hypothetical protein
MASAIRRRLSTCPAAEATRLKFAPNRGGTRRGWVPCVDFFDTFLT